MSERVGERIDGVIVAKTSMPVMRVSIRENLGADPRGKTQQQLIMMLTEHFAKDSTRLIGCDTCNGYSDKDLKGCPYCGEADEVADASVSFEEGESVSVDNVVVLPQTKPKQHQLVPVEKVMPPSKADERIKRWVAKFEIARAETGMAFWNMGRVLIEARDENLWRLKTDAAGAMKFTNFYLFAEAELGMSKNRVAELIEIATAFEKEMLTRCSRVIINAAFRVPAAMRQTIFQGIRDGVDEYELMARLKSAKRLPEGGEGVPPEVVEERAKLVTLVSKPTKQRVKLFMSGDEDKRAKRIGDRPKGLLELERGTLVFEVGVDEAGNMELIVKALPPER